MHNLIHKMFLAAVMLIVALPACTGRATDQSQLSLIGEYRIADGERNGAPIDQKELNDAAVYINDKTIIAYDKQRQEMFAVTYMLETKHTPWQITMISTKAPDVGAVSKGLIEIAQNNVKLIYALPNGQPPTMFKAGERQQMFVLTKADAATTVRPKS